VVDFLIVALRVLADLWVDGTGYRHAPAARRSDLSSEQPYDRLFLAGTDQEKTGSDASVMKNAINDEVILAARLFLATLFLIFGWRKLRDYSGTVSQLVQDRLPMPALAAAIAMFMELPVAFAIAVGAFTRLSALLMVLYTLGTSLIEHRYWEAKGVDYVASLEGFYKNLSIMGGFLLLYITGPGKYSLDVLCGIAAP
jgi:putative oxidoreductase